MAAVNALPLKLQAPYSLMKTRDITLEPGELLLTIVLSILFGIFLSFFAVCVFHHFSRESPGPHRPSPLPTRRTVNLGPFLDDLPPALPPGWADVVRAGPSNYGTMLSPTGAAALNPAGHRRPKSPVPSYPSSPPAQTGPSAGLLAAIEELMRPVTPTNPGITISPPISEYSPRRSRAVSEPIRIKSKPPPKLDLQQYAYGSNFAAEDFLAPKTATQGRRGPGGKRILAPIPERSDTGTSEWSEYEWDKNTGRMVKKAAYMTASESGKLVSPTADSFKSKGSEEEQDDEQDDDVFEGAEGPGNSDCRQS